MWYLGGVFGSAPAAKAMSAKPRSVVSIRIRAVWARRAQLMSAFSYYAYGENAKSIESARRFLSIHPGNRDAPYALRPQEQCSQEDRVQEQRKSEPSRGSGAAAVMPVVQPVEHLEIVSGRQLRQAAVDRQPRPKREGGGDGAVVDEHGGQRRQRRPRGQRRRQ